MLLTWLLLNCSQLLHWHALLLFYVVQSVAVYISHFFCCNTRWVCPAVTGLHLQVFFEHRYVPQPLSRQHQCIWCLLLSFPVPQTVLSLFLPFTLIAALFPSRIQCRAYELPASRLYNRSHEQYFIPATARIAQQQAQQRQLLWGLLANCKGAISVALHKLGEELAVTLRGVYLMALFAPVLLAAPLVFYAGVGRERWMQLLRWTLEQAGPAFIKWGQWGSTR